jgi:hypothetical protein
MTHRSGTAAWWIGTTARATDARVPRARHTDHGAFALRRPIAALASWINPSRRRSRSRMGPARLAWGNRASGRDQRSAPARLLARSGCCRATWSRTRQVSAPRNYASEAYSAGYPPAPAVGGLGPPDRGGARRVAAPERCASYAGRRSARSLGPLQREHARDDLFNLLRALGLEPIEWSAAVKSTGTTKPYNGQAVEAAFDTAPSRGHSPRPRRAGRAAQRPTRSERPV